MTKTKVVLITGGGARVGRAMALALAEDGWDVVVHARKRDAAAVETVGRIRALKRKALVVTADLRDAGAVGRLIPGLAHKGVRLDCLINNASAFERDDIESLTPESFERHMETNLLAPLLLTRDFADHYRGKAGLVVNIADGMLGWSVSPNFLSYGLSKLGLMDATELLALALAPRIRVNAIAPGPTLPGKQDKKDTFAKLSKRIPLKRASSPAEIIGALRYLISAPSVTGQVLALSGGVALGRFRPPAAV